LVQLKIEFDKRVNECVQFELLILKIRYEAIKIYRDSDSLHLKQHSQGVKTTVLARSNGISEKTIYRWKSRYGGMNVKELKRLKELEAENSKLKRM